MLVAIARARCPLPALWVSPDRGRRARRQSLPREPVIPLPIRHELGPIVCSELS